MVPSNGDEKKERIRHQERCLTPGALLDTTRRQGATRHAKNFVSHVNAYLKQACQESGFERLDIGLESHTTVRIKQSQSVHELNCVGYHRVCNYCVLAYDFYKQSENCNMNASAYSNLE